MTKTEHRYRFRPPGAGSFRLTVRLPAGRRPAGAHFLAIEVAAALGANDLEHLSSAVLPPPPARPGPGAGGPWDDPRWYSLAEHRPPPGVVVEWRADADPGLYIGFLSASHYPVTIIRWLAGFGPGPLVSLTHWRHPPRDSHQDLRRWFSEITAQLPEEER